MSWRDRARQEAYARDCGTPRPPELCVCGHDRDEHEGDVFGPNGRCIHWKGCENRCPRYRPAVLDVQWIEENGAAVEGAFKSVSVDFARGRYARLT